MVSAVGEAPLSRRGLGPEAVFDQGAGVVGSCVHIGLLQWVEAGFVIWNQVVLVQGLWEEEGTKGGVERQTGETDRRVKEIGSRSTKGHSNC